MCKLDELRALCEATMLDIVCIVEIWLDSSVPDNELVISNYPLFRLDRKQRGDGIAIYVQSLFHVMC